LKLACDAIRFSISFYCFAKYYERNKRVVKFSFLVDQYKNEQILIKKAENMAKGKEKITSFQVRALIKKIRYLTSID